MGLCSFACDLIDITGTLVVVVVGRGSSTACYFPSSWSASVLNLTHGKCTGCFGFRLLLKREPEQETERPSDKDGGCQSVHVIIYTERDRGSLMYIHFRWHQITHSHETLASSRFISIRVNQEERNCSVTR